MKFAKKRPKMWPVHVIYSIAIAVVAYCAYREPRPMPGYLIWGAIGVGWIVVWILRARLIRFNQKMWDKYMT